MFEVQRRRRFWKGTEESMGMHFKGKCGVGEVEFRKKERRTGRQGKKS